ncbi:hypothetical protein FA15DRAFT_658679 [Coprinopsis marcescibilis]|uniref:Uncharacterized protein n=1 Tax=Coprinopsis marcescibilis TaxID=230819 RepID=A0A5C3KLA2_COPMA|nr:hypothetical protein FA15DRAFT_658679 [Coprinopsis marcescibilis]
MYSHWLYWEEKLRSAHSRSDGRNRPSGPHRTSLYLTVRLILSSNDTLANSFMGLVVLGTINMRGTALTVKPTAATPVGLFRTPSYHIGPGPPMATCSVPVANLKSKRPSLSKPSDSGGSMLLHFLRQVEASHFHTSHSPPRILSWDPESEALRNWPCDYIEVCIGLVEVLPASSGSILNGEYIAECASRRCGYFAIPLPAEALSMVSDFDSESIQGSGIYKALPVSDLYSRGTRKCLQVEAPVNIATATQDFTELYSRGLSEGSSTCGHRKRFKHGHRADTVSPGLDDNSKPTMASGSGSLKEREDDSESDSEYDASLSHDGNWGLDGLMVTAVVLQSLSGGLPVAQCYVLLYAPYSHVIAVQVASRREIEVKDPRPKPETATPSRGILRPRQLSVQMESKELPIPLPKARETRTIPALFDVIERQDQMIIAQNGYLKQCRTSLDHILHFCQPMSKDYRFQTVLGRLGIAGCHSADTSMLPIAWGPMPTLSANHYRDTTNIPRPPGRPSAPPLSSSCCLYSNSTFDWSSTGSWHVVYKIFATPLCIILVDRHRAVTVVQEESPEWGWWQERTRKL